MVNLLEIRATKAYEERDFKKALKNFQEMAKYFRHSVVYKNIGQIMVGVLCDENFACLVCPSSELPVLSTVNTRNCSTTLMVHERPMTWELSWGMRKSIYTTKRVGFGFS